MPSKPFRRRHAAGVRETNIFQRRPDDMDRLAFKYMEMCKVESSSDSESDTSPRGSDASSKSLQGCTGHKKPTFPQKPFGWQYLQPLDPYDGSSEDSASSADDPKRQKPGGFRMKGRCCRAAMNSMPILEVRRPEPNDGVAVAHLTDVQMRSSSDSELKAINQGDFFYSARKYANTEMPKKSCLYPSVVPSDTKTPYQLADGPFKNSTQPCTFSKRKLFCPLANEEYMHRKKQCLTQMETETIFPERG